MSRIPKKVRITEDHEQYKTGEEYFVSGICKAGGYVFYVADAEPNQPLELICGSKSEVIE